MKGGQMFADTASGMVEVVSLNAAELGRLPYDLAEGLYVVGSGSTGAAAGLGICGEQSIVWCKRQLWLTLLALAWETMMKT